MVCWPAYTSSHVSGTWSRLVTYSSDEEAVEEDRIVNTRRDVEPNVAYDSFEVCWARYLLESFLRRR